MENLVIRLETEKDYKAVEELVRETLQGNGPYRPLHRVACRV